MSNEELMTAAIENTAAAVSRLREAYEIGQTTPVPAGNFTAALVHLRTAMSATMSLEQRARGVKPPKMGD